MKIVFTAGSLYQQMPPTAKIVFKAGTLDQSLGAPEVAAGYANAVIGVASGDIGSIIGVATADIDKVIGS
jgi:hypothetical protein